MTPAVVHVEEGKSVPCSVAWTDSIGRPLEVEDVQASLYTYNGNVRSVLIEPALMVQTDQTHRYILRFMIPEGYLGKYLYVEFTATLISDNSALSSDLILYVIDPLSDGGITPSPIVRVL